jgi:hypothetical protein
MGGWSSVEMVRRYAHLAADHLAPMPNAFAFCAPSIPTLKAQIRHRPEKETARIAASRL